MPKVSVLQSSCFLCLCCLSVSLAFHIFLLRALNLYSFPLSFSLLFAFRQPNIRPKALEESTGVRLTRCLQFFTAYFPRYASTKSLMKSSVPHPFQLFLLPRHRLVLLRHHHLLLFLLALLLFLFFLLPLLLFHLRTPVFFSRS